MKIVVSIGLILLLQFNAFGQERLIERKFRLEKERIKLRRIMSITESSSYSQIQLYLQLSNWDCSEDNAKVTMTYEFDEQGNLIAIFDFKSTGVKVTSYKRNERGDCISKVYEYTDKIGNLRFRDSWEFTRNANGQIVKEELKRGTETLRVNLNEYDNLGQLIMQTTDDRYKWTINYDDKGNLIKLKECRMDQPDSFRCISVTTFEYKNNLLIKEIKQSASTWEIWEEFEYKYDANNNLVETIEIITSWESLNNGPTKSVFTKFRTTQSFDTDGKVLTASKFMGDEKKPLQCTFFNYILWTN